MKVLVWLFTVFYVITSLYEWVGTSNINTMILCSDNVFQGSLVINCVIFPYVKWEKKAEVDHYGFQNGLQ